MIFGNFSESARSIVSIGFEGCVVRAIVEYIYTDECSLLCDSSEANRDDRRMLAPKIIGLIEAANYFKLPVLCERARNTACSIMNRQPGLACVFLVICDDFADVVATVKDSALQLIRSRASAKAILKDIKCITQLTPPLLENILKDDKTEVDDFTLFLLLKRWTGDHAERCNIAKNLVKHIHLSRIDAPDLSTTVGTSGLVTVQQLCEAYKEQALHASDRLGLSFKRPRHFRAMWEGRNSVVLEYKQSTRYSVFSEEYWSHDLVRCPAMTPGSVHRWTIKVEKMYDSIRTGVVSSVDPSRHLQRFSWVLWSNGLKCYNVDGEESYEVGGDEPSHRADSIRESTGLSFKTGSEISMQLDLREKGGGTLSVSVDGNPFVILFSNMLAGLGFFDSGFLPMVSIKRAAKVCLIELTEVLD